MNFGWGFSDKDKKRQIIAENRMRGKMGEENYKLRANLSGYEVERTGKGHDFKLYKRDWITGKRRFIGYREVKTGNAKMSELQEKRHKQMRGKHKVIREDTLW